MDQLEKSVNTEKYPFIKKSIVREYLPCVNDSLRLWENKKGKEVKLKLFIKSKVLRMISRLLKNNPEIKREEILIQIHYSLQKLIEHDPLSTVLKANRLDKNFIPTTKNSKVIKRIEKIYKRAVLDGEDVLDKFQKAVGSDETMKLLNTGKTIVFCLHPQLSTLALPPFLLKNLTELSEENFNVVIGIKPEVAATTLFDEGELIRGISNILVCLPATDNAAIPGTENYAKRFNVGFALAVRNILRSDKPAVIIESPQGQRDIRLSSGRLLIPHLPPQTKGMMEKFFLKSGINILLAGFDYAKEFNWKHVTGLKKQEINANFEFIKDASEMSADEIMEQLAMVASRDNEKNQDNEKKNKNQVVYPSQAVWNRFSHLYLERRDKEVDTNISS